MSGFAETTLAAVRLVQFASAFFLLGAPAFALALVAGEAERRAFDAWLGRGLVVAAVGALASGVAWLDLDAAIMGGAWSDALDPQTLATVLFDTLFGHAWCWHLGLAAVLLVVVLAMPRHKSVLALLVVLAAAHVATLAWAGHAVMHRRSLAIVVQAVHLLAGALWLGSLPALHHVVRRARRDDWAGWEAPLRAVLPLYSDAGTVAVALILLTGIYNSLSLLHGVASFAVTPYGRVLLVKIFLVLPMIWVAAGNRYVLMPQIAASPAGAGPAAPLSRLVRAVAAEQVLGVLILAAVSVLGLLPPG